MRNLKRTLSLLLAAAMLMGMMVVGAGAVSSTDFTDSSEITREEAVGVMTALGVFEGTDSGAFDPNGTLTREQAAAIICRMLLGDDADDLTTNSVVFSDVSADRWSAGYIGYCAQQGILAGTGNGTFDPEGELTGLAFAKMCLVALGYNADSEGYVGTDWAINVAADALNAGITPSGIVLADALNREDAAQMAFQTLGADMVTYTGSGSTTVNTPDGSSVIITGAAEEVTNDEDDDYRYVTSDRDDVQQFCEYYFEDLEKREGYPDEFGRPSVRWRLGSSEIGTFSETPDGSYTEAVDKGELYDVIGRDVYSEFGGDATLYVYVNGEEMEEDSDFEISDYFVRNETDSAASTGRGVLTEIFVDDDDSDNVKVTITHIFTYVAQVDGDYVESDGELDLATLEGTDLDYGYIGWGQYINEPIDVTDYTLYDEYFPNLSAYSDGDYVLVTVAQGEIQSISPATELTGEVTAYTRGTSATVDGTRYYYSKSYADAVDSDVEYNLNDEYLVILDDDGYVVYDEGADGVENYVFITAVAPTGGVSSDVEARAYFQTGTETTIDLDSDSSASSYAAEGNGEYEDDTDSSATDLVDYGDRTYVNSWYEYDEQSDGSYELSDVSGSGSAVITAEDDIDLALSGSAYVYYSNDNGRVRANNSTVFIINDDDDVNVYAGVRNVPDVTLNDGQTAVVAWVLDDNYAAVVYIGSDDMSVSGGSDDRVYILDNSPSSNVDTDGNDYYEYDAIVNGEIGTVSANSESIFDEVGLYSDIQYDSDEYVSDADLVSGTSDDDFKGWVDLYDTVITYSDGILSFVGYRGSSRSVDEDLVLADDYTIFFNDDGDGETMTASSLARDYDDEDSCFTGHIYVFENDDDETQEIYVYEYDVDDSGSGGSGGDSGDTEETETAELASLTIKGVEADISGTRITVSLTSSVAQGSRTVAVGENAEGTTTTISLLASDGTTATSGSATSALAAGTYTLTSTLNGESVTYTLTVTYADSVDITVSAANATVKNADGETLSGSSADQAVVGEDYTFTVVPADGYQLDDDDNSYVTYQVGSDEPVTLAGSNGAYTIPGDAITGDDITISVVVKGADANVTLSVIDGVAAVLEGSGDSYTLTVPKTQDANNVSKLSSLIEATGTADSLEIKSSNVTIDRTNGLAAIITFNGPNGGAAQEITVTIVAADDTTKVEKDLAAAQEDIEDGITAVSLASPTESNVLADLNSQLSTLFSGGGAWGSTITATASRVGDYTMPSAGGGGSMEISISLTVTSGDIIQSATIEMAVSVSNTSIA